MVALIVTLVDLFVSIVLYDRRLGLVDKDKTYVCPFYLSIHSMVVEVLGLMNVISCGEHTTKHS